VPTYVEHQRYRKLLGQEVMAEAWQRLMQRTCRQAGDGTDLAVSELTPEILYAIEEEAQENARRARSKLDEFLRTGQRYE
jgi:3-methyladenine DNA glycosylase/8-oxoguanine DNA glycosylase